jgi:hypothetical protein
MAMKPPAAVEDVLQVIEALSLTEQMWLLFLLRQRGPDPIRNSLRMTDHLLRDFFEREAERCNGPRRQAERLERRNQLLHSLRTELQFSRKAAYKHLVDEYHDLMRKGSTIITPESLERGYTDWLKRRPPLQKAT